MAIKPLVIAGEQLGVEIRPATIQKIIIMSLLAKQNGYTPVFLLEDRDVISKADKLTSWLFPSATPNPQGEFASRIFFDDINAKKLKQLPLKFGVISAESAAASAQMRKLYAEAIDPAALPHGLIGLDDIATLIAECAAQAGNIAEYGQRQLFAILQRLGVSNILFADLGAWEDELHASGALQALFSEPVRATLRELGCMPAGSREYWGLHLGGCHGRVHIATDDAASCLRCHQPVPAGEWQFLSLRAIPRMYAIASLGVDLFVTGGTSEYNDLVGQLFQALDQPMFPLIWKSGFDYHGPLQHTATTPATRQGKYTFLDALIASGHAAALQQQSNGAMGGDAAATRQQLLSSAYQSLSDSMHAQISAQGVHWAEAGAATCNA
ncbi:hypothetical protein SAMN02745857_01061 [Andreprevotia lacus DSM 23236]|uniref:Uncharacterized protein n=1 Tax=Andreprevotia lacus DSM 23236 TaxID=1121001 RepID=A0A1W1XB01_9NEIS|nr:hypothetical protein [Andreprevotia lacus]SMC20868.1 hypothetical protein SAMN02745857_01061 [Andreprevotia lacus DSM 23236]